MSGKGKAMRKHEKLILLVLAILAVALGFLMLTWQPDNCWSHYATEQQAIENCEQN